MRSTYAVIPVLLVTLLRLLPWLALLLFLFAILRLR